MTCPEFHSESEVDEFGSLLVELCASLDDSKACDLRQATEICSVPGALTPVDDQGLVELEASDVGAVLLISERGLPDDDALGEGDEETLEAGLADDDDSDVPVVDVPTKWAPSMSMQDFIVLTTGSKRTATATGRFRWPRRAVG